MQGSLYENVDHHGESSDTLVEYLIYQSRYENETVDSETRNVIIRPGYDKLTPVKWRKRRECGGTIYDSLIRETDLRCKCRGGGMKDSESEGNMNIPTILKVPSGDERSPACLIDRRRSQKNSLGDFEFGGTGNDLKTSEVKGEVKQSTGNLSPRSQAALKMEVWTGSFEFNGSDLIDAEHEKIVNEENAHDERTSDHLGRSSVTPVKYLIHQPRYENEAVDSETRNMVVRPGYDKLTPATRRK